MQRKWKPTPESHNFSPRIDKITAFFCLEKSFLKQVAKVSGLKTLRLVFITMFLKQITMFFM
jgi:hypothetical protein